jgi:hypothetical protein
LDQTGVGLYVGCKEGDVHFLTPVGVEPVEINVAAREFGVYRLVCGDRYGVFGPFVRFEIVGVGDGDGQGVRRLHVVEVTDPDVVRPVGFDGVADAVGPAGTTNTTGREKVTVCALEIELDQTGVGLYVGCKEGDVHFLTPVGVEPVEINVAADF